MSGFQGNWVIALGKWVIGLGKWVIRFESPLQNITFLKVVFSDYRNITFRPEVISGRGKGPPHGVGGGSENLA